MPLVAFNFKTYIFYSFYKRFRAYIIWLQKTEKLPGICILGSFCTVRIEFLCPQHNRTPRLTGTLKHRKAVFILFGPYRLIPVQNKLEVLIINLL